MSKLNLSILIIALAITIPAYAFAEPYGSISEDLIARFEKDIGDDPSLTPIVNAATNNDLRDISLNRELIRSHNSQFNFELKGTKIIDQKSSGRCWMFAGANVVTPRVMTKLKLSDFGLSQAYLAFWDKLEKSNLLLEKMIELRARDINDRSLQMWLEDPVGDGGWWQYFEALIQKYGVVPASAMPETKQSSSTARTTELLSTLLRKATAEIRRMHQSGKKESDLRRYKEQALADVYRLLVCAYGRPPKEFVFRYEESKKDSSVLGLSVDSAAQADTTKGKDTSETKVLVDHTYTPHTFYQEFYGDMSGEYVALSHNPAMKDRTLYQLSGGRNVFERTDLQVLNMPIEVLKDYAFKMIRDSQIVWFACDVGRDNYRDSGMFAAGIWDYGISLGIDFATTKADRISYHDTSPNHAMVLLAVDTTESGRPRKWKVENSWGSGQGSGGYWTMYDSWFDENVLLVIVDRELLSTEDAALFAQKPVMVEDWQPFFRALTRLR
ncbi:MAG: C1 family peptidase [Candidatus Zixiibacteriota bacterium]